MLKKISTKLVRKGMYVHALDGAWMDHPFWKSKFVIEDAEDIKKLLGSPVKHVLIDTSKGLDVLEQVTAEPTTPEPVTPEQEPTVVEVVHPKVVERISASKERKAAEKAISASKKAVESMFQDIRMGKAISQEAVGGLVEDITASVSRNESALISLVRLKTKDDYTYMHSVAVCALMVALGKQLKLTESEIRQAGAAGLMHDLGKAMIPIEVLNKPGALTPEEFDLVKLHPERGHELLLAGQVQDEIVLDVCLHHHEKIDGSGYPHKLNDQNISLYARMGAVCDVYDAVTSNRPYKAGWEPGTSLQRMAQWKGHFDDRIFKAFVKSVGIYPVGSTVKLKSGRLAVVIDANPNALLMPIVKVFFSTKSKQRIPLEVIDLSTPTVNDEILGCEDPATWGITDVNRLWTEGD